MTIQVIDPKVASLDNLLTDMEGANLVALNNDEMTEIDGGIPPLLIAAGIVGGVFLLGVAAGYAYEKLSH